LGIHTKLRNSGSDGNVGRGKKLEENRENATERLQVEKPMGKKRKEKGNNNRGETGDQRKESRKGRRKGCMERDVHIANEWWKILRVYSKEMRITTRRVENTMKKDREEWMLVRGDFNGRIGERGARNWEGEKGDGKRKTKDKLENAEGKRPME
jgi:hypothetical protein